MTDFERIKAKIKRAPKGTLFILADFAQLNITYNTLKELVRRLVKAGDLNLVFRGIYQKPNFNSFLKRDIPATPNEVAQAYIRKNKWLSIPAGDTALNLLGLTTQVPNSYTYKSIGPNREITLNNGQKIEFKKVLPREIAVCPTSALVIEALKTIGEQNIEENDLKIIKNKLTDSDLKQLKKDSVSSRIWIQNTINRLDEVS
ncbi:DUF6088 family protein [Xylocopilactobacillus apicola]|uniref:Transcriptional regulator, AbiEi antitoxin, Type IV TA system n=1 Tax=Xylocopilactobacillus apicola TaxID=2932184 RepID=A0AAU9D8M1_9LACO|nr:DUF6088 family protein [Xylocopilactobacillus apicola]BDR57820.1 hypothetical protein XA3_02610 [Xylocopilactobacillus apicola]